MSNQKNNRRELAPVINVSGQIVRFEIALGSTHDPVDEHELEPGGIVEIDAAYARPQSVKADRDPRPSSIDLLTNGKVLAIDDHRAAPHPKAVAYREKMEKRAAARAERDKQAASEKRI